MTNRGTFTYAEIERIVYGTPFVDAIVAEADRLGVERIYVLASGTLARETDCLARLKGRMGNRIAGVFDRLRPHVQRDDVLAATAEARTAGADLILTVGGGTPTDAAKMVTLCLANDVTGYDDFDTLRWVSHPDGTAIEPALKAPTIDTVCVPTTLSAGEFSASAGCTDTSKQTKQAYRHPAMAPRVVILDPEISRHTPEWLWLSTGIRAVDHCVEDLCSINLQPYVEGTATHALKLLGPGLQRCKADPADLDARLDCLIGAWMSMVGSAAGVAKGASHGIGHMLGGTANVPHGYTSCVMLPNVLRWNASVNGAQQTAVSAALGRPDDPAAEVIGDLIAGLGLPTRLRDVNVTREQLPVVAEKAMHDRWIPTNPRKIATPAQVAEILEMAW